MLVIGGTGGRRPGVGLAIISADTAALPGDGREPRSGARPDPGKPIASGIVDSPSPQRCSATSSTRAETSCAARFRSDAPTARRARRARQDQHRAHRRDRRRRGCLTRESRPAADALRVSPRSVGLTRFWSAKDSRDVRYPVSGWRRPGVRFEFRGNPIPGRRLVASLRHLRRACAGGMSPECAVTPEHRLALAR